MKQKIQKLNLSERSHERLRFISKVTSIPMTRLISEVIDCMFSLSINYKQATFRCFDVVTEDTVNIIIHGYGKKLSVSRVPIDANATEDEIDKVLHDRMVERANRDLAEQFGENKV